MRQFSRNRAIPPGSRAENTGPADCSMACSTFVTTSVIGSPVPSSFRKQGRLPRRVRSPLLLDRLNDGNHAVGNCHRPPREACLHSTDDPLTAERMRIGLLSGLQAIRLRPVTVLTDAKLPAV